MKQNGTPYRISQQLTEKNNNLTEEERL